ncbi:MAG: chromosomal replication initiator protein DnaA, partial [Chloroflexi bacterium RBG_16_57_9]
MMLAMSQNLMPTSAPLSLDAIWQATLGDLQLQLTKATFDTWLKPTYPVSHEDGTFVIATRTVYVKDWLENRMMSQIKRALSNVIGRSVEIKFTVRPMQTPHPEPIGLLLDMPIPAETDPPRSKLQKQYTFDTFVVGESNQLAHAAARAVADVPAIRYNPLFVYGGVGLGKTHLMHAIGHATMNHGREVLYVSSEEFTNDLVQSIRVHNTADFRFKYRAVDLLLVDDIQFIAGKESTQEEFFHTFNTLHSTGKQIVLTSDRPPKAINTLERRLCSRFEGGLIVDIQPPNLETRMAILQAKADEHGWDVHFNVLQLVAQKFHGNIRELEGGFNR